MKGGIVIPILILVLGPPLLVWMHIRQQPRCHYCGKPCSTAATRHRHEHTTHHHE